jgi:hypothetical protein
MTVFTGVQRRWGQGCLFIKLKCYLSTYSTGQTDFSVGLWLAMVSLPYISAIHLTSYNWKYPFQECDLGWVRHWENESIRFFYPCLENITGLPVKKGSDSLNCFWCGWVLLKETITWYYLNPKHNIAPQLV